MPNRYWRLTLFIVALYIFVFSLFVLGRYERYNATGEDLAFYNQILWRTAHGDMMGMSLEGTNLSNWAFHVEPILLLLAPLKLIFTDARWWLIFQTIVLAVAAIPVYRIAVRQWQKPWAGFVFAALYLLYPSVGWANKFDIHPLALATPLLLFAWDAIEQKRYRWTAIFLLLAMLCKEEVGFVVACFGLYWYFAPTPGDRWRSGLRWFMLGIIWSLVGLFIIIPAAQGKLFLPNQADLRYAWLFHGTLQDKWAYITGPDTKFKLLFLAQLFMPLAFIPLLRPRILAIAGPILALSLLSAKPSQSSIYYQYMADVVPFLFIAAIKGSYDLKTRWRPVFQRIGLRPASIQRLAFITMGCATLGMFMAFNPFVFIPREPYSPLYGWESGASISGLTAASALIPPESCLTATNNIAAHYGDRKYLYVIGIGDYTKCDLALIDLADRRYSILDNSNLLPATPQQYACIAFEKLNFNPIFYQDHVVILKKDALVNDAWNSDLKAFCQGEGGS